MKIFRSRNTNFVIKPVVLSIHLALCSGLMMLSSAALSSEHNQSISYNIAAGNLNQVLNQFAAKSGVAIAMDGAQLARIRSNGLKGSYTIEQGFATLLVNTSLQAQKTANGYVLVEKTGSTVRDMGQLKEIDVNANSRIQTTSGSDAIMLPVITVAAEKDIYAGGQFARTGQVGMLGNRDIMDTPFSQTNYTAEYIQDAQLQTLGDIFRRDPSLAIDAPPGAQWEGITARGFRQSDDTSSFMLNGLFGILPTNTTDLSVIERVEVFKGPSALLNGMPPGNALGGTMNIVSKRAKDEPAAQLTTSFTSQKQISNHLDVGRRFGTENQFGARLNATYRNGERILSDNNTERTSTILGLDYRGEKLRISTDLGHQNDHLDGMNRPLFGINSLARTQIPVISNKINYLPSWLYNNNKSTFGMANFEFDVSKHLNIYGAIGHRYTETSILFINPSLQNEAGDWSGTVNGGAPAGKNKTTSGSLGLNTSFNTGIFHHQVNINASQLETQGSTGGTSTCSANPCSVTGNIYHPYDGPQIFRTAEGEVSWGTKNKRASYGIADTISLFDKKLQFIAGIRNQKVESPTYESDVWSPAFAILGKPLDNVSVYVNYIEGLLPGTEVGKDYDNEGEVFPPYQTEQYEAGVKVDWNQQLMTNLAIYQIAQPQTLEEVTNTEKGKRLTLNGERRNRGVELTVFGEPIEGLRLNGGAAYTQAVQQKTKDGINEGNLVAGVPEWKFTLGIDWDVPYVEGLSANFNAIHSDRVYHDNANTIEIPSWQTFNAGLRYKSTNAFNNKPIVVRFNIDNLLDDNYWITRVNLGNGFNTPTPRTYMLSTTFNF